MTRFKQADWRDQRLVDERKAKPCKWAGCNGHYVNNICNRCGHNLLQLGTPQK